MPNIEEHIRKAMENGKFGELPGKGKPLHLEENPHEDPEWRLAHHMIRSSGFSLPWIELNKEIDAGIAQARENLAQAWAWRQEALDTSTSSNQVEAEWRRAQEAFREKIGQINKLIADYNILVPSERVQRIKLNAAKEIAVITAQ